MVITIPFVFPLRTWAKEHSKGLFAGVNPGGFATLHHVSEDQKHQNFPVGVLGDPFWVQWSKKFSALCAEYRGKCASRGSPHSA